MDIGYFPGLDLSYNFPFIWGVLELGFFSGVNVESTLFGLNGGYDLYSIPVGLLAGYTSGFSFPVNFFVEVNSGAVLNIFRYKEEIEDASAQFVLKWFVNPSLGITFQVISGLDLMLQGSLLLINFKDQLYQAITPGLGIRFRI